MTDGFGEGNIHLVVVMGQFLFIVDQKPDGYIYGNTQATLNTNTVEGFSATPVQPITPAVITSGTIWESSEHKQNTQRSKQVQHT